MKDWAAIRSRYVRDALPVRLGGLAANLGRITSFAAHDANCEVVKDLLVETKFFIEWTAPETEIDAAAELVNLQVRLALWERRWTSIWVDKEQRRRVAEQSRAWAKRVLELSGLSQPAKSP